MKGFVLVGSIVQLREHGLEKKLRERTGEACNSAFEPIMRLGGYENGSVNKSA